ncbi:unnamed protein product [Oppiella nova]|uniref:Uncharacterized protein n=1 Tax=Oppiella nova TaxID=334625 RepID=A0A7R9QKW2_9ACAR|nr:unnamed protein product [Oppiella nova]CAG2167632.1 unnamed protein product [Oppiella nova]
MASMDSTPEELVREARDMLTKRLNVGQLPRDKRGIFGMVVDLCSALIGLFPFLGPIIYSKNPEIIMNLTLVFTALLVVIMASVVMASDEPTVMEVVREARDLIANSQLGQVLREKRGLIGALVLILAVVINVVPVLGQILSVVLILLVFVGLLVAIVASVVMASEDPKPEEVVRAVRDLIGNSPAGQILRKERGLIGALVTILAVVINVVPVLGQILSAVLILVRVLLFVLI